MKPLAFPFARPIVLAAALGALAAPALAARTDAPAPGTYPLKDGTTLVVADNGWMRMFTADGKRLHMQDGVMMETRDGKSIAMKEDLNWKQLRQFGTLSPKSR
ncbi:MAG: CopK family periplasmic copper-binding protein [Burkholderiales bacterium]|nr:CopK family periplasmic copper-binding protein [Burkholderiales bacterium]MCL4690257.1 CopK family periplasmic copper-binding protein [Burkholderiales bacterium]